MGKKCVVESCPTGRTTNNKINTKPQFLSFFTPRTPTRLEKWKKSLGMDLKATDNICHFHFKAEDIKMFEKICINGEVKLLPTGKKRLKEESIPTIEHQFIPMPVQEYKRRVINVQEHNSYHNCSKQETIVDYEACNNLMDEHEQNQQDFQKLISIQQIQNDSKEYEEIQVITLSIDHFKQNIKQFSILPPFWLYVEKPNELEFIRVDQKIEQIKNHIRLNEDLSITVIFSNNEELHLNKKIISVQNIYNFLKSVEQWPSCVGTQIDDNEYSKNCTRVIVCDDAYKRTHPNPRCKSCQYLRVCLLCYKTTSTILEKTGTQIQHTENLVKQCKSPKRMCEPTFDTEQECIEESQIQIKHEKKEDQYKEVETCSEVRTYMVEGEKYYIKVLHEQNEYPIEFLSEVEVKEEETDVKEIENVSENNIVCEACGTKYAVHTGETPYACPHCDKSFPQSNGLKLHERTVYLNLPAPPKVRRSKPKKQ